MKEIDEKLPDPKELEKEIGEFLTKKFGQSVKIVSPVVMPKEDVADDTTRGPKKKKTVKFDLLPEELVAYLDQYIIKQDKAKTILATKICTHFNRIKHAARVNHDHFDMVGGIKNNVLMVGPTGVGKTYLIRLIAKKLGVPFVKGDATKFSETGYVGGDVEDLVRDLVREADGDIELAQYGIIYIDEIDKIASAANMIGADVSRTGVQRALLKPMEETDVELKVPHDPISMIQEIERFRKSGKREESVINTKNILFIMSGAFSGLSQIIRKRMTEQPIGFGAHLPSSQAQFDVLKHVKSEDLIAYGFESEFVGRLPVRSVFEELTEEDLLEILKNPNNPILLGKKLDFAAYGIDIKFSESALRGFAKRAFEENTGARGLVSAVEEALLLFENKLPSSNVKKLPVTSEMIAEPEKSVERILQEIHREEIDEIFATIREEEKRDIKEYVTANEKHLGRKYNLTLTDPKIDILAEYYIQHVTDIGAAVQKIKAFHDEVKKIELDFFKEQNINIVLEDDAIDYIIEQLVHGRQEFDRLYRKIVADFEHGLKLVREKTGKSRFFITKKGLESPDEYIGNLLRSNLPPTDLIQAEQLQKKE